MKETFELPVTYKNETILLPAELQASGYSHRIVVVLNGQDIILEPDEERHYRATIAESKKAPDAELVKAIVETVESLFRS